MSYIAHHRTTKKKSAGREKKYWMGDETKKENRGTEQNGSYKKSGGSLYGEEKAPIWLEDGSSKLAGPIPIALRKDGEVTSTRRRRSIQSFKKGKETRT